MPTGQHQKRERGPDSCVSDEVALVIYASLLSAWIGCLLWSSLATHLPTVPRILAWDKLQHFFAYAVLMFFSGHFFKLLLKKHQKGWIIGFIFTAGFGLLMEIGQETLSISRNADWKDFVANSLGAGLVLAIALLKRNKK
jgi:VanZ family protein